MAAAAEVGCDPAYIYRILGTEAYLKFLRAGLVHENGYLHAFGKTQLVNNAVHILSIYPIKLHFRLTQSTENAFSVQKGNAFQKSTAQNLVLDIGLFIKAVIDNRAEVNPFCHQLSRDFHGTGAGTGVFKYSCIMDQACIQALGRSFINLFLIQLFKQNLAGRACIFRYQIYLAEASIGDMVIQTQAL